jgi:hypothetical protein
MILSFPYWLCLKQMKIIDSGEVRHRHTIIKKLDSISTEFETTYFH